MGKNRSTPRSPKRQQFVEYRKGNRRAAMIGAGVLALFALSIYVAIGRTPAAPSAVQPSAEALPAGQDARLPASLFDDGRARFYRYTTSIGREIRLFVMRSSDGVIRAAFDACDVCYRERKGYYQAGDTMVCVNCGRRFESSNINVISGGCNPAPIQRTVEGSHVLLKASDLDLGAVYF
jgi:uncharacterized membrane protein